jgi:hypothetical protein
VVKARYVSSMNEQGGYCLTSNILPVRSLIEVGRKEKAVVEYRLMCRRLAHTQLNRYNVLTGGQIIKSAQTYFDRKGKNRLSGKGYII